LKDSLPGIQIAMAIALLPLDTFGLWRAADRCQRSHLQGPVETEILLVLGGA
jgi:hypothetical protein